MTEVPQRKNINLKTSGVDREMKPSNAGDKSPPVFIKQQREQPKEQEVPRTPQNTPNDAHTMHAAYAMSFQPLDPSD